MMDIDTSTHTTPLLDRIKNESDVGHVIDMKRRHVEEIQFYDPNAVLNIPKEVAMGYLILLTGGNFEFNKGNRNSIEINTGRGEGSADSYGGEQGEAIINEMKDAYQSSNNSIAIEEDHASLAFSAIVDGNVLHTCFGLKSGPNGRISALTDDIIRQKQSVSIFCCFPSASPSSLKNILPNKSKKQLTELLEILRDVKEMECESSKCNALHVNVITAYVQSFAAIVKFHDANTLLLNSCRGQSLSKTGSSPCGLFCSCPSLMTTLSILFSSKKSDLDLKTTQLRIETLREIENTFSSLRVDVVENAGKVELQTDTSVAESGVSEG